MRNVPTQKTIAYVLSVPTDVLVTQTIRSEETKRKISRVLFVKGANYCRYIQAKYSPQIRLGIIIFSAKGV